MFPEYTARERVADGCIHVLGVSGSLAAVVILMVMAAPALPVPSLASLAIYCVGLMAMFGFSAAYNMVSWPGPKAVLRRLDHSAIFVMIAGSYTPFALVAIGGAWGLGLFAAVWTIALVGVALSVTAPRLFGSISIGLYLAQGWVVLAALDPLIAQVPSRTMVLLGVGGLIYTAGVLFHVWERLPYNNAVWHAFVLAAAGVHYVAVLDVMALL